MGRVGSRGLYWLRIRLVCSPAPNMEAPTMDGVVFSDMHHTTQMIRKAGAPVCVLQFALSFRPHFVRSNF